MITEVNSGKTLKCDRHPEANAVGGCIRCERLVCTECKIIWLGRVYCRLCVDELAGIEARLAVQRESLREKETQPAQKKAELAQKEIEIGKKEAELAQKEIEIGKKEAELAREEIELAEKENKITADLEALKKAVESMTIMQDQDRQRRKVSVKCFYHPEDDAVVGCVRCGRFICTKCKTIVEEKVHCRTCADDVSTSQTAQAAFFEIKSLFREKPEIHKESERLSLQLLKRNINDDIDTKRV